MHDTDNPIVRQAYILMAAIAGAITALSLLKWRELTWAQIMMTVFVGTSFAVFVVPWATHDLFKIQDQTLRAACGLTYLGGTCANALLPRIIKKISKWLKLDDEVSS